MYVAMYVELQSVELRHFVLKSLVSIIRLHELVDN